MNQGKAKRDALVEAVLSRFFEHYTVVVTLDGRYIRRPLFVRRSGEGRHYRLNPDIPDAFFEQAELPTRCPCCGAGRPRPGSRGR